MRIFHYIITWIHCWSHIAKLLEKSINYKELQEGEAILITLIPSSFNLFYKVPLPSHNKVKEMI